MNEPAPIRPGGLPGGPAHGAFAPARSWAGPVVLVTSVFLAYASSLSGGFLNWDDPWLIQHNSTLRDAAGDALLRIWTDLSVRARLGLGAEFLPVRDTSYWLDVRSFGLNPQAMRLVQLGYYLLAVLLIRLALLRVLGRGIAVELAALCFALHPVHVESVAWLSGRKDVLALLFVGAGLSLHAHRQPTLRRDLGVVLCLVLATLSKSMAIAAVGLLPALDLLAQRSLRVRPLLLSIVVLSPVAWIHWSVGADVHMTEELTDRTRWNAAATMGPVILRYLTSSVVPLQLSLVHDVPLREEWTWIGASGWTFALASLVFASMRARRGARGDLAVWLCFFVPLLPVSQVLFPLQNLMADRYLFLSVLAPCLLLGRVARAGPRWTTWLALTYVGALGFLTGLRASLFTDSRLVFADAVAHTRRAPAAPYQLAYAFEENGQTLHAEDMYREAIRRAEPRHHLARKARNNLARSLVQRGALAEAERLLAESNELWPKHAKVEGNLAEVWALQGKHEEARALCSKLVARVGSSKPGARRCLARWGESE